MIGIVVAAFEDEKTEWSVYLKMSICITKIISFFL